MSGTVKSWTIRLLKYFSIGACGLFALAVLLTSFYSAEIKQMIIGELNKSLVSPVQVGDVSFSILRHFPYASVELRQVKAMDAPAEGTPTSLLEADRIAFLFNIAGLFSHDVTVKKVVMKEGRLHIRIDKNGNDNYHIWKSSSDTAASVIDLQKIVLEKVNITYSDVYADQDYLLDVHEAALKGRFASDDFTLDVKSALFVDRLRIGSVNYVARKEVKLDSRLAVNYKNGKYSIGESELQVAGLHFRVGGEVIDEPGKQGIYTNLNIQSKDGSLEELLTLLPAEVAGRYKKYKSHGRFALEMSITGGGTRSRGRNVSMNFSVRDGKISPPDASVSLTALNCSGSYRSSPGKEDVLSIPHLTASLNGHAVEAGLQLSRLSQPYMSLHARADLELADLRPFLATDTIESLSGRIRFDVALAGKVSDMTSRSGFPSRVTSSGTVHLTDGAMKLRHNTLDFRGINGSFQLRDNNLDIQSFTGNVSSTDFAVSGTLQNLVSYLLVPGQVVSLDGRFASNRMNLDELIVTKNDASPGDTTYLLKFNPRLTCNFQVNVGSLQFRKFRAEAITGTLRLKNQVISSPDLAFRSMGGTARMNATVNASLRDKVVMACDADIAGIDIKEMFTQLENFDQQTLTDRHLKGRLDAGVKFTSDWSTSLVIRPATAKAHCSIVIENGELNGFTPILALSRYLKVADLNNIRFSTLKNEVNIADRKIYIPAMEIKSSALNLTASGVHDFDNMVDYKLKMLLSDVLGKKVKQHSEFGEIEDDGLGHLQLLLTMKGPVDNPKFAYDRKGVRDKIRNDLAADRQNVKQMLKEEFGFFKKDTTKVQPKAQKKEELQVDWNANE